MLSRVVDAAWDPFCRATGLSTLDRSFVRMHDPWVTVHGTATLDDESPVVGWNALPGDAWAWWDGHRYVAISVGTAAPDHHRDLIEDWGPRPVPNPTAGWNPVPGHLGVWALFENGYFPLIARRSVEGWTFVRNGPIDLPLPGASRARRWLIGWTAVAAAALVTTFWVPFWALSPGSGTPLRQPCVATDSRGVALWLAMIVLSVALASIAVPLFRWARHPLGRTERRSWAIGMSIGIAFLLPMLLWLPCMLLLSGMSCGL